MKKISLAIVLIIIVFLSYGGNALCYSGTSDKRLLLNDNKSEFELTGYVKFFEDSSKSIAITDILAGADDISFSDLNTEGYSEGINESILWYRFSVENTEQFEKRMLVEIAKPHLDIVDIYEVKDNNVVQSRRMGRSMPFIQRPVEHRYFLFNTQFAPKEIKTFYISVSTKSFVTLPVKLWDPIRYIEKDSKEQLGLGLFYGIMLAMLIYNLFLFIWLRNTTYIYYSLYIVSFIILQAIWDGLGYQYIWGSFPDWDARANPFFLSATCMFELLFVRSFLSMREFSPALDKVIKILAGLFAVLMEIVILADPAITIKIVIVLIGIAAMTLLIALVKVWRDRREFYYFAVACGFFVGGGVLNLLAAYGILPVNALTLNGPRIGICLEAFILSIGLADKINTIRQEKEVEKRQKQILEKLRDITKNITSTYKIHELIEKVYKNLAALHGSGGIVVIIKDEEHFNYISSQSFNDKSKSIQSISIEKLFSMSCFEKCCDTKEPRMFDTIELQELGFVECLNTVQIIPVVHLEEVEGYIVFINSQDNLNSKDMDLIFHFAGQVGIAVNNINLIRKVNWLAITDGLTGISDRRNFFNLAEQMFAVYGRSEGGLSVLMLDIDNFKNLNDTYGHVSGDEILKYVAHELSLGIRKNDAVARYGGEEFVAALPLTTINHAVQTAERIRKAIGSRPIEIDNKTIFVTVSIGVSSCLLGDNCFEDILKRADKALYIAKNGGKDRVEIQLHN